MLSELKLINLMTVKQLIMYKLENILLVNKMVFKKRRINLIIIYRILLKRIYLNQERLKICQESMINLNKLNLVKDMV